MKNKPAVQIQFPNILLIPVIAIIASILKVFGLTQYDWLNILISIPISIYFLWCVGYCILVMLGLMIAKLLKNKRG